MISKDSGLNQMGSQKKVLEIMERGLHCSKKMFSIEKYKKEKNVFLT